MAKYKYEACERETDFYQNMADRTSFEVFTMDPAIIRKMEKAGATFLKGTKEDGMFYTLSAGQLTIRSAPKPPKPPTEKQLAARAALRRINEQRLKAGDTVEHGELAHEKVRDGI